MYKKVLKERWIDILLIGIVTSGIADAIAYFGGLAPKYMDILPSYSQSANSHAKAPSQRINRRNFDLMRRFTRNNPFAKN